MTNERRQKCRECGKGPDAAEGCSRVVCSMRRPVTAAVVGGGYNVPSRSDQSMPGAGGCSRRMPSVSTEGDL